MLANSFSYFLNFLSLLSGSVTLGVNKESVLAVWDNVVYDLFPKLMVVTAGKPCLSIEDLILGMKS